MVIYSLSGSPRQALYVSKCSGLVKTIPTNLERSASFLGLSLTFLYGRQFQISPGKVLNFQTNASSVTLKLHSTVVGTHT